VFAESLAMTCEKLRVQFGEVKEACNTLKRPEHGYQIQILEANSGVGGHCLPKDLRYLLSLSASELLEGAILADKSYRLWCKRLKEDEIKAYV
jgi:UDP-N-acetyl-D-mannosaminuronate dehydrogenase